MLGISTTNARVGGFRGGISAEAKTIYNRIIADGGVSNLSRLNFFVKGLKTIYGSLSNVPVCYDAHWIGYKLGSGTGATSGQAAAKLYSLTVAGDAVQSTAASQPLLLSHNGVDNYFFSPKINGNSCTSPSSVAANISSDFEIIVKADMRDTSTDGMFIGKADTVGQRSYYLYYTGGTGTINFVISTNGTNFFTASSTNYSITANTIFWLKVTRTGTTVTFYKSIDGITYTTINVTSLSGNIFAGTDQLTIGNGIAGGYPYGGKIYRATISNSIGGAPVVDFNPATYNASTSQTAWTSSTGEIWTINTGTATTGYKGQLVSKTIVMSDGVDDKMTSSVITAISDRTNYIAVKTNENSGYVIDDINTLAANGVLLRTLPGIGIITNAATVTEASAVNRTLKLSTTKLSTLTQGSAINNGTEVTGVVIGAQTTDGVMVFANGNGGSYSNINLNTLVISNSADNATNRTAMYNLIRSLNNNAF